MQRAMRTPAARRDQCGPLIGQRHHALRDEDKEVLRLKKTRTRGREERDRGEETGSRSEREEAVRAGGNERAVKGRGKRDAKRMVEKRGAKRKTSNGRDLKLPGSAA